MKVTYIDHMGTDLSVVNAARVSFAKKSEWEIQHVSCEEYEDGDFSQWTVAEEFTSPYYGFSLRRLGSGDAKLINYLAKHNHWTPFGHTAVTLHVKAPLFVARQLGKHQVGLVWNEVSRRYVDDEPEFYVPDVWRKRAENVKQGSSDEPAASHVQTPYSTRAYGVCLNNYHYLLEQGVCPEQARMVLPQSMMTEWYWTGSIAAFSRVCKLRLDSHTQQETREIAQQISRVIKPLFPVSWAALQGREI